MKDYKEVTAIVLKKSEKVKIENKKNLRKLSVAIVSFVLIIGIGFAVWFNSFSKEKTVISHYTNSYLESVESCYRTPGNGETVKSNAFNYALNIYNEDAYFRVITELFSGKYPVLEEIEVYENEANRLKKLGYEAEVVQIRKKYSENAPGNIYRLDIIASKNMFKDFQESESFGYFMELYDESGILSYLGIAG